MPFSHLHVHSQFSVLQATSSVQALIDQAVEAGMPAMGLTDRGNMMGAFHFVRAANKAGIKPIVGAELNVCRDHADRSKKDDGYPIVLLAEEPRRVPPVGQAQFTGLYRRLLLRAAD